MSTEYWVILFEDADVAPEIFTDEHAAKKRYEEARTNWSCHLMAPYQKVQDLQAATIKVADLGGKAAVDLSGRIAALEAENAALKERWEKALSEAREAAGHEFGLWPLGAAASMHMLRAENAALREDKDACQNFYEHGRQQIHNTAEALNWLVSLCHGRSKDAGWWDGVDPNDKNVYGAKIALIHSEASESLEGDRKDLMDDHLPHRKMAEVELADAVIRICDLAGVTGIDLGGAVAEKLEYNRTRKDHTREARAAAGGKKI